MIDFVCFCRESREVFATLKCNVECEIWSREFSRFVAKLSFLGQMSGALRSLSRGGSKTYLTILKQVDKNFVPVLGLLRTSVCKFLDEWSILLKGGESVTGQK